MRGIESRLQRIERLAVPRFETIEVVHCETVAGVRRFVDQAGKPVENVTPIVWLRPRDLEALLP